MLKEIKNRNNSNTWYKKCSIYSFGTYTYKTYQKQYEENNKSLYQVFFAKYKIATKRSYNKAS